MWSMSHTMYLIWRRQYEKRDCSLSFVCCWFVLPGILFEFGFIFAMLVIGYDGHNADKDKENEHDSRYDGLYA